jgi:hypothetical protein
MKQCNLALCANFVGIAGTANVTSWRHKDKKHGQNHEGRLIKGSKDS